MNRGLLIAIILCVFPAYAGPVEDAIEERIARVGEVCVEGLDCASATPTSGGGGADGVESFYNGSCSACHALGIANAPKFGDASQWSERVDKGRDVLYTSVIQGLGTMPPRGTCAGCSDDDLKAIVDYMLDALE
ncbi:MAG: c-type cytochrome [Pseudomonadota bacterium]